MKIVPEPDHLDARVPLGLLAVSIATLLLSALLTLVVRWSAPASQAAPGGAASRVAAARIAPATAAPAALEGALPRPLTARELPGVPAGGLFERHEPAVSTRDAPERLKRYGWVDRERRLVHIPIDRAKELYLARGQGVPSPVVPQEGWHGR
ncbi:MAG TPA: hypothetical protein VNN80_15325 [Polyangiaceae bacterium]|jgi:hypothetical protein|nr:hypothetical protein [Polyangiaceae bacterium]